MHYSEDKAYHSWWTFKRTLSHREKLLAFNKAKWQCGYVAVCVWQVGVCSHLSSGDSRLSSFRHVKGSRDLTQVHTHLQHWAAGNINSQMQRWPIHQHLLDGEFLDQREKDGYALDSANTIKPRFTKRRHAFICKKETVLHKAVHFFMSQQTLMYRYVMQLELDNIGNAFAIIYLAI